MSKNKSDHLFILIKSMRKGEKRYFKVSQGTSSNDSNYLKLFDTIERSEEFDEERILSQNDWIKPTQFSNMKAHLYNKLLKSLRDYTLQSNDDILAHEQLDQIQLLYDRGLYNQCVVLLGKIKRSMRKNENLELWLEILKWEKNLLPYIHSKDMEKHVQNIVSSANDVSKRINRVNELTNLSLELNAIYRRQGYLRNEEDYRQIKKIFEEKMPLGMEKLSKNEHLIWYEINVSFYSFIQDFESTYQYAKLWVNLFSSVPNTSYYFEMYIKGLNKLLNAQARLNLYEEFKKTQGVLRSLANHRLVQINENIRLRMTKYNYAHQFNGYFITGDFKTGVKLLRKIESRMEQFIGTLDRHSELILFYKIACLYFGNEDYQDAVKWLNRILNSESKDLREDVHSFARLLNLITHYELTNLDVIEYYLRSTYRYIHKKDDLHIYQSYILDFIKQLNRHMTESELKSQFKILLNRMLELSQSTYDKRAFVYFDIISWLESKLQDRPVADIIREKVGSNLAHHVHQPIM